VRVVSETKKDKMSKRGDQFLVIMIVCLALSCVSAFYAETLGNGVAIILMIAGSILGGVSIGINMILDNLKEKR